VELQHRKFEHAVVCQQENGRICQRSKVSFQIHQINFVQTGVPDNRRTVIKRKCAAQRLSGWICGVSVTPYIAQIDCTENFKIQMEAARHEKECWFSAEPACGLIYSAM
jgi:hypothetical protein